MVGDVLTIAALFLIPGSAGWLAFGERLRKRVTAVETLFLILLGSLVTISWVGMLLAELGLFSLPLLLGLVLGGSLIVSCWAVGIGRSPNPFKNTAFLPNSLLALPILALAIWLAPQPFEYINGGRDHGLYVNTGVNIARTGSILIEDDELTAVPSPSRSLLTNPYVTANNEPVPGPWSQGQRLSGMTIRNLEQGIIAPHAFHLYPVWIALFDAVGGLELALTVTTVLALLGAFGLYIAGARLFGQPVGLLAFFMLVGSLAQVWYAQSPSAEILLQPLFWGGLFAFSLMLETQNRYTAVLAGLSFGLMHLAKLDTVLIPPVLLIFFLYRWFRNRFSPTFWTFIVTYGLLALHAVLHAFFIATIYFLDQVTRVLLPDYLAQRVVTAATGYTQPTEILGRLVRQNGGLIAAGLVGVGLLLWAARRFRPAIGRRLARAERNVQWGRGAFALALGMTIGGVYLVQSFRPLNELAHPWQFLTFSSWYLTSLGMLLGVVGLVQIIVQNPQEHKAVPFTALLLVGNILPLFLLGAGTFPDQFWAIRRFVPVVLPAFILSAAYLLWNLMPTRRQSWPQALLPVGLAGVLVVGQIQNLRPFLHFRDYGGMINQVTQLAGSFPEDAVLLFEKSDAANRVAVPMWLIFERTVFVLEDGAITNPDIIPAIEKWWANGREIFWLGSGSESPTLRGDIVTHYEGERTFAVSLAEAPIGRLPQSVGLFLGTFDVHRAAVGDLGIRQTVTTIAVGQGEDGVAPAAGLHTSHNQPGLTPRRWTSGHVVMQLPLPGQLSQIVLMMGNGRPINVPQAEVAIYLNDTHLDTVRVEGVNDVYNLTIPPGLELSGETAVLRLEMEPWTPAQTGHSGDKRPLGVYLDWIKLITVETNEQ